MLSLLLALGGLNKLRIVICYIMWKWIVSLWMQMWRMLGLFSLHGLSFSCRLACACSYGDRRLPSSKKRIIPNKQTLFMCLLILHCWEQVTKPRSDARGRKKRVPRYGRSFQIISQRPYIEEEEELYSLFCSQKPMKKIKLIHMN